MNIEETPSAAEETPDFRFFTFNSDRTSILGVRHGIPKDISILEGAREISSYAFQKSGIENAKLPSSVRKILDSAFMECSSLRSIDLSNSLESIGESTSSGAHLFHL